MRAWEEFLAQQEVELGAETVRKWLRPLKIVRFDACNLYLEAPDSFKALWFEEHIRPRVHTRLCNNNQKAIKVHVAVGTPKEAEKKTKKPFSGTDHQPFELLFDSLNSSFTFEHFVTCSGNLLAYKLLKESCEAPPSHDLSSSSFNPIFLFGRSGTGKTHLLMATANQFRARGQKAIYVRAETFTEHVVAAIRSGEMQTFRKTYRAADALIIDDIEVFSRKTATQEELFHTFNTLHTSGKQIILSSSCSPPELKLIEPRLVSRFEWGIVIPLQGFLRKAYDKFCRKKSKTPH